MFNRTLLLSLVTGLSLLSAPVTQAMAWDFWTRHNYRNTWRAGGGAATVGLIYYIWQLATRPETPEECYAKTQKIISNLHTHYDAKIVAFERGYKITSDDITLKNEAFLAAQIKWRAQIDEEALAHLGAFSGCWSPKCIKSDVQRLSAARVELSKMRRELLQEKNKNLLLARQIEELLADVSLLLLQLTFFHDCVAYNVQYLDFLVSEKTVAKNYAHVMNISATSAHLKQIICKNSTEKNHPYIKFVQALSKDLATFTQNINQVSDDLQSTKLFRRAQQLQNALLGIERRIHADKTLHRDLRNYQTELLSQMRKQAKSLYTAINRTQTQADNTRDLERRLSVVIATYQAYQVWQNANGNQQNNNNVISQWELDKVRVIAQDIEKIFTEIQEARDNVRSLGKEISRMQARFDEANISVPEQLSLQIKVEQSIQGTESAIQTIQKAEQSTRKSADNLYTWARNNGLFLV